MNVSSPPPSHIHQFQINGSSAVIMVSVTMFLEHCSTVQEHLESVM